MLLMVNATAWVNVGDACLAIALRAIFQSVSFAQGVSPSSSRIVMQPPQACDQKWRATWVDQLNILCNFQKKGMETLDASKTVAFVPKKLTAEMTATVQAAANAGWGGSLGKDLSKQPACAIAHASGEASAQVVLPAVHASEDTPIPEVKSQR